MPALLVRHQHSRFQLRRPTAVTSALGIAVLIAAGFLLLVAIFPALGDLRGLPCPAFFGVGLLLVGARLVGNGALLLESFGGITYVAALDRPLNPGELQAIRIARRGPDVDVIFELQGSVVSVTHGFLKATDPDGLATLLAAQLGVPAQVALVQ